jgi:hypothetical protein
MVENYFDKFDADKAIKKMMNGSKWPRAEYTWPDGNPYNSTHIKAKWDVIGEYSRNKGTWMHFNIERYFNDLQPATNLVEMSQFFNFKKDVMDAMEITPYRTEWRLVAPDLSIGGSVDFIGTTTDGSYVLIDWKRAKDLSSHLKDSYGGRRAK